MRRAVQCPKCGAPAWLHYGVYKSVAGYIICLACDSDTPVGGKDVRSLMPFDEDPAEAEARHKTTGQTVAAA